VVNANYGLSLGAYFGAALNTADISATDLVPSIFPVSIDGKPYALDLNNPMGGNLYRRDSVALLRTQADSARTAGESSVSPEIFWRRSFDSWHQGTGQTHADRETSSPYRFRRSKGMDVWDKGELKALNDVALCNGSGENTIGTPSGSIGLISAGSRLYAFNGDKVYYTTGGAAPWLWTAVTGTPTGTSVNYIDSDGKNVFIAYPSAIWKTDTSISSATSFASAPSGTTWYGVGIRKGKLFSSGLNGILYEIRNNGSHVAVIDKSNRGFNWQGAASVGGYLYFGGYLGDKSVIYKSTLTAEGVDLAPGIAAGELPDGEVVTHLGDYLGYLIIGTSKGVRFANTDAQGYITIGGLIETGQPVYCTEGQDRFVWFGWGNYDAISSGLGRMDLSEFTATLTPAYASDLMAGWPALETGSASPIAASPVLGNVTSVVTFGGNRVFTVSGKGVYAETSAKVKIANLETGLISHGIIDNKYAAFLDGRTQPFTAGNVMKLSYSVNSDDYEVSGSLKTEGSVYTGEFFVGKQNRNIEVQVTFGDIVVDGLLGADVNCTGFMVRSYPAPKRVSKFSVPILLFDMVNQADREWSGNPGADFQFLLNLHKSQLPFTFQEGEVSYTVVMDDFQWLPEKRSNVSGFQGTFVAVLREIL
jgi:hypothetical protein